MSHDRKSQSSYFFSCSNLRILFLSDMIDHFLPVDFKRQQAERTQGPFQGLKQELKQTVLNEDDILWLSVDLKVKDSAAATVVAVVEKGQQRL